jgi:hypothetical protein
MNSLSASAPRTPTIRGEQLPPFALAVVPILIVLAVNLIMSLLVLPRMYIGFLAEPRFGETSLSAVSYSPITCIW